MSEETEKPLDQMTPRERSNAVGTANLEKHRDATKFGGEKSNIQNNKPGGANTKSWSIRHSVKYLAGQPIDMSDPKKAFALLLPPKPTVAQVIAANSLAKATKADMRAVEYVTEQIDGKVAQPNINADLAALETMTDEQLYEIIDRFNAQRTDHRPDGDGGHEHPAEAGGSETPA